MPTEVKRTTREDYGPPIWPSFEQIQKLLARWQAEHPGVMQTDTMATSAEGRPVYAVQLTDPETNEETKEHVLITGLHSGVERSGTTTILCLMEWLLSADPAAQEILRRQLVVCMPVPNPDAYVAGKHGNVYGPWNLDGPKDPDRMPEAMAVKKIMDELQPEVHADIHGLSMDFERYIMLENSASSYSNLASRCYHHEIIHEMDEAALAEGYPSDWQESDAERIFWGPELDAMTEKLWVGRPRIYASTYCYNRYHTLLSPSEVSWERSGLLRHRRLMEIGNETWPGEHYPGYPTRVIASNNYHMVTAYGQTAAARRRSRVELWSKLGQLDYGQVDPFVEGKILYVCATSPATSAKWIRDKTLQAMTAGLADHPEIVAEPIQQFAAGWPHGQNRPEAYIHMRGGGKPTDEAAPIEHGLCLRLRIPYEKATLTDLRLNGKPLDGSETDGYTTWSARGYRYVQINIPPNQSCSQDLFIVTCAYDPHEKRERWRGWDIP